MDDGLCKYGSGDVVNISDPTVLNRLLTEDCQIGEGVTLRLYYSDDSKMEQPDSVAPIKKPLKKRVKPMEPTSPAPEPASEQAPPAPSSLSTVPTPSAPLVAPPVPTTVASTQVPAAPFDINSIVGATGGNSSVAIVLALLAVVGGTAAWKFWQKLSEQKHEQAMRKMELEAEASSGKGPQHPLCVSANATIESRLSVLDSKLAALDSKLESLSSRESSFSASFDPDDLDDRLKKMERKLKTLSAKGRDQKDDSK